MLIWVTRSPTSRNLEASVSTMHIMLFLQSWRINVAIPIISAASKAI